MAEQGSAEFERGKRPPLRNYTAREAAPDHTVLDQDPLQVVHPDVEHVHGPEEVSYGADELVVLCLVRNGRPYVRSFVEHYLSLGVKHLVFLDNGSTDGTVEALKAYPNVTVLCTTLPFKEYQMPMKQYLIERFGRERWSLYVDIDELFDYPYSDVISLSSLLGYLSSKSYTAVVGQMLDMFSEEPLSGGAGSSGLEDDVTLKELHKFYDISNVRVQDYWEFPFVSGTGNVLANKDIEIYRNGIQNTLFGTLPALTKHPLVFLDGKVKAVDRSAHSVSNARIADFTCVLFHYKFTDYLYELIREAARQENYMKDSGKQKRWLKVLEKTPNLLIKRETAREIESVNDLVENGFLVVSEEYMMLASNEKYKGARHAPRGELGRPENEAFYRPRIEAKVQSLRARRLERRAEELKSSLAEERSKARSLEEANRILANRLERIQASKSWRILNRLTRVWNRMFFRKNTSGGVGTDLSQERPDS